MGRLMALATAGLTSARLTFRIHRFEVLAVTAIGLIVAASALIVTYRLDSVGVTAHCLVQWIAGSGPTDAGACVDSVSRWAAVNEDEGGKVLAAMALVPYAIGLLLGVPLVGRELESRSAATAWSMAGSRARWLFGRLVPVLLLLLVLTIVAGAAAAVLEGARSGGGLWSNVYRDAQLFGAPVVAHGLAGLGIGLLAGALVGRTLPALIVGAVLCLVLLAVGGEVAAGWESGHPIDDALGASHGAAVCTSGKPGVCQAPADPAAVLSDPDFTFIFATSDGRALDATAALGSIPAGTTDVDGWLHNTYQIIFGGLSPAATAEWQLAETIGFGLLGGALILFTVPVVERARPT